MRVESVNASPRHTLRKPGRLSIRLVQGYGVQGDAHAGPTVKHRSRVRRDPAQPNLRQVHLIHGELHDELAERGFKVGPGEMGENVTTRGIDLLALPTGTRLRLGADAVVEITGLRNPCKQLERLQAGLMAAVLDHDDAGEIVRKAGVMAVVRAGGDVHAGDPIEVELPAAPHRRLRPVESQPIRALTSSRSSSGRPSSPAATRARSRRTTSTISGAPSRNDDRSPAPTVPLGTPARSSTAAGSASWAVSHSTGAALSSGTNTRAPGSQPSKAGW